MKKNTNRRFLLFVIVGVLLLLAGCDDDQVAVVQQPADVRCELAKVWAGPGGASPLPQLTDCGSSSSWQNLPQDGWVTTDKNGEAWLKIMGCQTIYLFQNSELRKSACPKSSAGNAVCSIAGTSAYNNQCSSEVIIQTPSADLVLQGTWLSVTYLPERELTLVVVLEGKVQVRPVLDLESRKLGESIPVAEGEFLYTAPDPALEQIGDVPPRAPGPLDQLGPVIEALGIQPWMDRVWRRAEADRVSIPSTRGGAEGAGVVLRGGGGPLENELVQEAVLYAVDWVALSERFLPGQDAPVAVELPDRQSDDVRDVGYDPERAQELMKEGGYDGFGLTLLYPYDDESLTNMAGKMTNWLGAIGIDTALEEVPDSAEVEQRMRFMIAAGEPVLWLSRR